MLAFGIDIGYAAVKTAVVDGKNHVIMLTTPCTVGISGGW